MNHLTRIEPHPKRDADAAKLAADGHTWPTYTLKVAYGAFPAGTIFYRVPSRSNPDQRWLANGVACRCPDYQQRGAMCAHVRAVRLFEASQEQEGSAEEAGPTTPADKPAVIVLDVLDDRISLTDSGWKLVSKPVKRLEEIWSTCQASGCDNDPESGSHSCHRHQLVDVF